MKTLLTLALLLPLSLRAFELKPVEPAAISAVAGAASDLLAAKNYRAAAQVYAAGMNLDEHERSFWLGLVDSMIGLNEISEAQKGIDEIRHNFGPGADLNKRESALKAMPGYDKAMQQSNLGALKGDQAALQSAVSIYYADNEGKYPDALDAKPFLGKYIDEIPKEPVTGSNKVASKFTGKGGWFYDKETGKVRPNLSGNDPSGTPYREYGNH